MASEKDWAWRTWMRKSKCKLTTQRDSRQRYIVAFCLLIYSVFWLVFVNSIHMRVTRGERTSAEGLPPSNWPVRMSFGGVFTIDWCGKSQSNVGSTLPEQGALGCIRKTTEEAMGSRPGSSVSWWSLLQFLPPGSFLWFLTILEALTRKPDNTVTF